MKIISCGSVPTILGPEKWFTGKVLQTPVIAKEEPARLRSTLVTFLPGARTNWHTHPLGQTLFVTSGFGLIQVWDGPIQRVRAGDVVSFDPGEKHWHGAASDSTMTHVAMQEADATGNYADWMEPVTDAQYGASQG